MRREFSETDLAQPLVSHLSAQGWTVRSEVKDCDIAATRGEELLVVEVKKSLSLALLVQAARRQRITDTVYVAIPRPSNKWAWWKESRGTQHLLRRLELGLILVSLEPGKPAVEVVFHPLPFARKKRAKSRRVVLQEIAHRTADYNRAGSNRTKLATAYRENAIHVACCLLKRGTLSPAELRSLGTGEKTYSILRNNVYGWFERLDTGSYGLTSRGRVELALFPELAAHYAALLRGRRVSRAAGGRPARSRAPVRTSAAPAKKKRGTRLVPPRSVSPGPVSSP
jgi:hypothetical protein